MVSVPYEEEYMGHTIRVRPEDRKLRVDGVVLDEYDGRVFDQQLLDEVKMWLRNAEVSKSVQKDKPRRGELTHAELLRFVNALPDNVHSNNVNVSEINVDKIKPLIEEYGGIIPLVNAARQRTIDGSEEVYQINDPNPIQVKENDSRAVQRDSEDAVKAAKKAYVDGEIGEMELEKRLEEAIEVPHDFTADTL